MRALDVVTPDGLTIRAYEWGNPAGHEILFVHGFSQCALAFRRQFEDPALAAEFRLVAYDLRGHGASDKPTLRESYADDRRWADELAAVVASARLKRPVLVAWSYAGRVASDYVRFYGVDGLAGINFVNARTKSGSEHEGADLKHLAGMCSDDLGENIAATRAFLRACFFRQPGAEDFETMLAYNMVAPANVRAAVLQRSDNPGDMLARLTLPVLVTQGARDGLVLTSLAELTAAAAPRARLSLYQDIGHSPFFEDAPRFNAELAAFARAAL